MARDERRRGMPHRFQPERLEIRNEGQLIVDTLITCSETRRIYMTLEKWADAKYTGESIATHTSRRGLRFKHYVEDIVDQRTLSWPLRVGL